MLFIAHRGNFSGKNPARENEPGYIDEALALGYDVEIDLRIVNNRLYLGHDTPQYSVSAEWLFDRQENIWIHCKNLQAFHWAICKQLKHAFFHDQDDYTLTTCHKIWTFPGKAVVPLSILVLFENDVLPEVEMFGYCSDVVMTHVLPKNTFQK